MSTRATYGFKGEYEGKNVVYIHSDGYLEGAAYYFNEFHHQQDNNGSPCSRFIRANDGATLTRGHKYHGDTQFQYDYDERSGNLKAYEIHRKYSSDYSTSTSTLELKFDGLYSDFVNKYIGQSWAKGYEYIMHIEKSKGIVNRFVTGSELNAQLERLQTELKEYNEKFPDRDQSYTKQNITTIKEYIVEYNKFASRLKTLTDLQDKQPAGV